MSENKYMIDYDKVNSAEKRELRRKRRVRARVISWIIFVVLILLLGTFSFLLFKNVLGVSFNKKNPVDEPVTETSVSIEEDIIDDVLDDLIGKEEDVVITEPEPVGPTEEELFEEAIISYVSAMTLEDKVAGLFIVSPEQITNVTTVIKAGDGTKEALNKYAVGGLIYAPDNIISEEQFKTMLANTKTYARYPLFCALDEEVGNTVLGSKLKLESTKTAKEIGDTMDPQVAYDEETKIATYLSDYGINLNLGIVADIIPEEDESSESESEGSKTSDKEANFMESRSFGSNETVVNAMVPRVIEALNDKKIYSAVKYFPGLAIGNQDTSKGISSSDKTKEDLLENEFKIFKTAVDAGAGMLVVSHISMPELTGNSNQSSLSKDIMTDLLRLELGFDDLVIITDEMDKAAISDYYDSQDSSIAAIKAGADMILKPANFEEAYSAVIEAVSKGVISEARINDSLLRVYKLKFKGMSSESVLALLQ